MKCFLLAALGTLCLTSSGFAIVDSNNNGMSDYWERFFNGQELFPPGFNPGDDPDGDGATNLDECNAGTDPYDGTPPAGFLQAKVTHVPPVYVTPEGGGDPELQSPEAFVISWPTQYGKQYTLLCSPDLSAASWLPFGELEYGYGDVVQIATLPTYQDGSVADKFFWRVAVTDIDTDGDGFTDYDESLKGTNIWVADRDEDELPDEWEILHGLDPNDDGTTNPDNGPYGDPDGDGLLNLYEHWHNSDPHNPDTDADGLTDYEEANVTYTTPTINDSDHDGTLDGAEDPDGDGLSNLAELHTHHTDPRNADTDYDTLRDGWEIANGFDPLVYNSITDPDGDDLTNAQEQLLGLSPLDSDTDDDGTPDGAEDPDGDGLTNLAELNIHHTNPLKADSDNDSLSDDVEINTHLTDPNKYDTDGDGMPDGWEIQRGLDPKNATGLNGADGDPDNDGLGNFNEWLNCCDPHDADSDNDGADDLAEVNQGSDPNDPTDGGNPPDDEVQEINFKAYGDYASWRMEIQGEGPRDHKTVIVVTPAVGVPETGSVKLLRNNKYKVTLHHTGSKDAPRAPWYCWEALVDDKPYEQTFSSYEPDRIPGAAMFFTIGEGHWLVDNRDGLFTTHNHRTETEGGNVAAGLEATLLPMETTVGDAQDIETEPEGFVAAEATPAPSVDMTVTSSTLQGADLHIRLQGTVKDSVSRFAQTATERPQTLNFYHQDELLHSIPLDETVGNGFTFDETVVVANAQPETYVIRAETTVNIAGNKGYDESAVSLTWEEDATSFPVLSAPLSIAFAAAPANGTVDQATIFVGNTAPQAGDTASVETAADSLTFTGNLRIPAQPTDITAPCQLKLFYSPAFSTTEPDTIVVRVEFTAPGFPKNQLYGRWVETGANTLIFNPGNWIIGNRALKTSQTCNRDLRGSQPSDIEACTIRFPSLPESLTGDGLQVVSGGVAYDLINRGGTWYPEDPNQPGEIKRFMPSAHPVPARLLAPGYDPQQGSLKFFLRYPGTSDFDAGEILVVPGEEAPEPPIVASANAPTAGRIYSLQEASTETPPPWQPGNPVIPEHVICAYRFLNADDTFALELLNGYLRGGHKIETGDVNGDLDLDVALHNLLTHADNIWTIQIEEDVNPVHAARLLFEGLKQASANKEVYDNYTFKESVDEILAFNTLIAVAVQKTQETAISATEMYLSGLGVVNEGLDWIIVVNDVSEGHWSSLAAALPFIPAGLVKTGGHLIIRKGASEVIDTLDSAGVDALKQLYRENDLRVMGVTMDEYHFSESLRKALSTGSGPITPPTDGMRDGLRKAMEELGPKPNGKFTAHHDFPWEMKHWFAEHGIDVNNPAFGRWVTAHDHWTWHSGPFGKGGQFHHEWRVFIENEATNAANNGVYTYTEVIDKLASIRAQFSVTGGND